MDRYTINLWVEVDADSYEEANTIARQITHDLRNRYDNDSDIIDIECLDGIPPEWDDEQIDYNSDRDLDWPSNIE